MCVCVRVSVFVWACVFVCVLPCVYAFVLAGVCVGSPITVATRVTGIGLGHNLSECIKNCMCAHTTCTILRSKKLIVYRLETHAEHTHRYGKAE